MIRWCKRIILCMLLCTAMYVTWSQLTNLTVQDVITYEQQPVQVKKLVLKEVHLRSKQQVNDEGNSNPG
ncbi:hypothetical protein SAMN05421503_1069 [Terribacillus aidingensis]|uniref:Uncharacterized protein n=1 Tax=Terribacillus aidingensis TaxID=586416 RepID=A0A285NE14_9BACI|nr:hypothetical protein SAMN05421503_1069 [Terribacillus aidingensis]